MVIAIDRRYKVNYNLFYLPFFLLLFCLSVLKDVSVGVDTATYKDIFEWIQKNNDFGRYEPAFVYLNLFSKNIYNNFNFFLLLVFTIIFFNINFFLKKISENHTLSITIFFLFFFIEFNSMLRQAIAVSFFMRGIIYLNEKNKKKYFLTAIIAFLFHYSAIIIFFIPLISKIRFKVYKIVFMILVIFIITLNFNFNINFFVPESYGKYFTEKGTSGLYAIGQLLLGLSYYIIYLFTKNNSRKKKITDSTDFNNWMITLFVLMSLLSSVLPVLSRFTWYFAVPFLYLIPNNFIYDSCTTKQFYSIIFLTTVFLAYQTVIFIYRPNWGGFYPYTTFF